CLLRHTSPLPPPTLLLPTWVLAAPILALTLNMPSAAMPPLSKHYLLANKNCISLQPQKTRFPLVLLMLLGGYVLPSKTMQPLHNNFSLPSHRATLAT